MPVYSLYQQIPPEVVEAVDQLAGRDIAIILGIAMIAIAIAAIIFGIGQARSAGTQSESIKSEGSMAISIGSMATSIAAMSKSLNDKIESDAKQTETLQKLALAQEKSTESDTQTRMEIRNLQHVVQELKVQQANWTPPEELLLNARELREAANELRLIARNVEQKARS